MNINTICVKCIVVRTRSFNKVVNVYDSCLSFASYFIILSRNQICRRSYPLIYPFPLHDLLHRLLWKRNKQIPLLYSCDTKTKGLMRHLSVAELCRVNTQVKWIVWKILQKEYNHKTWPLLKRSSSHSLGVVVDFTFFETFMNCLILQRNLPQFVCYILVQNANTCTMCRLY